MKSSNGHPLNAVSFQDGEFLSCNIVIYVLMFGFSCLCCMICRGWREIEIQLRHCALVVTKKCCNFSHQIEIFHYFDCMIIMMFSWFSPIRLSICFFLLNDYFNVWIEVFVLYDLINVDAFYRYSTVYIEGYSKCCNFVFHWIEIFHYSAWVVCVIWFRAVEERINSQVFFVIFCTFNGDICRFIWELTHRRSNRSLVRVQT